VAIKSHKNKIPGGLADKNDPSDFRKDQLEKGIEVELEHTEDRSLAREIAMDHLKEIPDYYDRLEKMEKEFENSAKRVASTWLKTSARKTMWHGTSSRYLQKILKVGLIPTPTEAQFEGEFRTDSGGRSLATYGGAYFTDNWGTAHVHASTATRNKGGNAVIIGATLETRTPTVWIDEDELMSYIERSSGLTRITELTNTGNPVGYAMAYNNIARGYSYYPGEFSPDEYPKFVSIVNELDWSKSIESFWSRVLEDRPRIQGRKKRQESQINASLENLYRLLAFHLFETVYQQNKEKIRKKITEDIEKAPNYYEGERLQEYIQTKRDQLSWLDNRPEEMRNTHTKLKNAVNKFSKRMKELSDPQAAEWAFQNNVRVQEPVTYRGKNRILIVAEEVPRKSELTKDRYYDVHIRYLSGGSILSEYKKAYAERQGGSYRIIHRGRVLEEQVASYHSYPSDIWGGGVMKLAKNKPTNPSLWAKVQALTKGEIKKLTHNKKTIQGPNDGKGFDKFPSAYANGWASKVYKQLGGGWKKESSENFRYGRPTPDQVTLLTSRTPKQYRGMFVKVPPPGKKQLQHEIEILKNLQDLYRDRWMSFVLEADRDFVSLFRRLWESKNLPVNEQEISRIIKESSIPITKLKFYYNHPRPFQFSSSFEPIDTQTGHSPSYPSGHTIQSFLVAHYLGMKFPSHKEDFYRLAEKISWSRAVGGVHWLSDLSYGKAIAYQFLNNNLKIARGKAKKDVGHGGLDEWFSGHGKGKSKDKGKATWGDWVAISPVKNKKHSPGDIVGPCGVSDDPAWEKITNKGKDPLKCMPRQKAYKMTKKERADLAKEKYRKEKSDKNKDKKPTYTKTFKSK
jgi:hypothetical protein